MSKYYNSGFGAWLGAIAAFVAVILIGTALAGPRTSEETVTRAIPYKTTYVEDDTLDYGKTAVRVRGVAGTSESVYRVTKTSGGKETKREFVSSKVTREPVTEVVARGTKPAWHCWDTTSFDQNPYNDNYCKYSDGSGKYAPDSEARRLDPSYSPGKSGAAYYNNF